MATFMSLPNELLTIICHEVYSLDDFYGRPGLSELAALTLTNRRLSIIANPFLYQRAVQYHNNRPLVWAAKRGVVETLRKALAAGASPNEFLCLELPTRQWAFAMDIQEAAAAWNNCDPAFWPGIDPRRELILRARLGRRFRNVTPTLTQLDAFMPTKTRIEAFHDIEPGAEDHFDHPDDEKFDLARMYTALHIASKEGHDDIVNMLLDHGALINAFSQHFCRCRRPTSRWSDFVNGVKRQPEDEPARWSALHVAVCSSRIETAKLLVSRGAPVLNHNELATGSADSDILHQAAASGHVDLLEHILRTHPQLNIDQEDHSGLTAFYYACANGRWDTTVPLLLARGACIDTTVRIYMGHDSVFTTPLGEACRLNRFQDALKLIDLGADITYVTKLMDRGAIGRPMSTKIRIPLLHLCCMDINNGQRHPQCLSEQNATAYEQAAQATSCSTVIAKLVAAGLSPDMRWDPGNSCQETALAVAVQHLNVRAVKALLEAGADVHASDSLGRNALMVAVGVLVNASLWSGTDWGDWAFLPCTNWEMPLPNDYHRRPTIVRLLLDAGTRINDRDSDGNTALHLLFSGQGWTSPQWIKPETLTHILLVLLARGADLCARNDEGETAFQFAVRYESVYALEIIAKQRCLDLVDAFAMDEIAKLFKDARNDDLEHLGPEIKYETAEDLQMRSKRLVELLLDMDYSHRLSSSPDFIRSCLDTEWNLSPLLEIVGILYRRGLEHTVLDSAMKLEVLRRAINAGRWDIASQLLETPASIDINAIDSNGENLLCLAIEKSASSEFILELIDAGADIHQIIPGTILDRAISASLKLATVKTAVRSAIGNGEMLESMLHRQPIRGNPQAAVPLYLHQVVCDATNYAQHAGVTGVFSWFGWDGSLRALLAAGADPAQVNEQGDTPLSFFLGELVAGDGGALIRDTVHWLKPLSRGVDVNRKNNDNMSVADYLQLLLADNTVGNVLKKHLLLVTKENGDREIEWRA